jgi:plastocyanin/uncharacterized membrane protein YozB (DUF420 family)
MQAILGQRLSSDINLVAQLLILVGLWAGFFFARRKQFRQHGRMQTSMVLVNMFFILFVMGTSFYNYIIAGGSVSGTVATLMILHGVVGLLAELTGIYLILRMNTNILPEWLCVQNFKIVMRALLGTWTALVLLGFGIYYARYLAPGLAGAAPSPASAAAPLSLLSNTIADVQIHADEMSAAVGRGELPTAKRHAEHLVNLIVGKNSLDYGDSDGDGAVEDPGDGTGAIGYLNHIRESDPAGAAVIDEMNGVLVGMVGDAKAVLQAQDATQVTGQVQQAAQLSAGLRGSPGALVDRLAQAMGARVVQPIVVTGPTPSAPESITVVMEDFVYTPRTIKVKQGTSIIFFNRDVAKHNIASDTDAFKSPNIASGESYTLKLDQPGTYLFYCTFHGDKGGVDMSGVIEVTP